MKKTDIPHCTEPSATLVMETGGRRFYASLEKNPSAEAFVKYLSPESMRLEMTDIDGFEKLSVLPWDLPQSEPDEIKPGDILLLGRCGIALCYKKAEKKAVRLASVFGMSEEDLGEGTVTVKLWLEWSE